MNFILRLKLIDLLQPLNSAMIKDRTLSEDAKNLYIQLINSSFYGLLTGLYLMCDAATDESLTETCLKYMQTFTALCGALDLCIPRDAFVIAFCRASLPPHYAHTILNMNYQELGFKGIFVLYCRNVKCKNICKILISLVDTHDMLTQYTGPCIENDFRHQVVAVCILNTS